MEHWETWTFADLLAEPVRNGIYKKKEFHGRGQKIINMGELFSYDFISSQEMKRVELNDRELANCLVKDGDLLFARRSFVLEGSGRCALVVQPPEDTTFESSLIRARPNPDWADPRFLFYLFRSPQGSALIASIATRTAVSGIRGSELALLKVPKPPLPTQHKIAVVLSTYDDLIENNTRRIKILEGMAQVIYREWFIEFRFPGHEQVEMVGSELGLIPQGWEVVTASEAISINPTASVPRHTEKSFVPMKSATEDSMLITEVEQRTGNSGSKFKNYDTLFARITPCLENGRTGFVQFLSSDDIIALGSTEFIVLRSKTLNPYFVYLLAQTHDFRDNAIKSMTGATGRQRVVNQCFDNYFLPNPDQDSLHQFECIIAPLFKQVQNLWKKNVNLRQTRDLLLPKLISGEIDVSELTIDID